MNASDFTPEQINQFYMAAWMGFYVVPVLVPAVIVVGLTYVKIVKAWLAPILLLVSSALVYFVLAIVQQGDRAFEGYLDSFGQFVGHTYVAAVIIFTYAVAGLVIVLQMRQSYIHAKIRTKKW